MSFFLKFGSEDQKKVFIPNYAPWIAAVCLLSRPNSRWGHVHNLAGRDGVFWSGSRLLSNNAGVKTKNKKRSSAQNLWLRRGVHSCFASWNKTLLALEGHEQYYGGHRSQNALQWHRACYFLLGLNPRSGEHISRVGGHKQ